MKLRISNQGFTLTELLVAMVIAGVVAAGIYSTFYSQHKSYMTQEEVVSMQQNLRSAMHLIEREIRMAGCDPTGTAGAGIQTAQANTIRITMDLTDDAGTGRPDGDTTDPGEDIIYTLSDMDADGDNDLARNDVNASGNVLMAENIDALNFVYLDETPATTATLPEIRSVQIAMVGRTGRPDRGYTDSSTYRNQQGTSIYAANDSFRRRVLATDIKCRNLGL